MQLSHASEALDHFERDKNDPRGEERYDTPIENGIHRVDAFGTTPIVEFL